mmetsp:Transcript_3150/g.13152  ORF Transcript_3150/g.13152 Transcript_3150/m.13152 type:complete len:253 (+) Transcript_3150:1019-1777(+)
MRKSTATATTNDDIFTPSVRSARSGCFVYVAQRPPREKRLPQKKSLRTARTNRLRSPVRRVGLAHHHESPKRDRGVRGERARVIQRKNARDALRDEKETKRGLKEKGHGAAAFGPLLRARVCKPPVRRARAQHLGFLLPPPHGPLRHRVRVHGHIARVEAVEVHVARRHRELAFGELPETPRAERASQHRFTVFVRVLDGHVHHLGERRPRVSFHFSFRVTGRTLFVQTVILRLPLPGVFTQQQRQAFGPRP